MRGKNTTKKIPSSKYKRKPSTKRKPNIKRKPSTKRKPNKKHAHVGWHGATSQKNEKKGGNRNRVEVVAAVWGHGAIVSKGEPGYVYMPPDNTELNLIAFKPQGCSVWGSYRTISQIDTLITEKVDAGEDVFGVVHPMTDFHNSTVAEARALGDARSVDALTTDHGNTIFGVSRDYGRTTTTKGNKVYSPYGLTGGLGVMDVTGYNPHNHVLVRLYLIKSPDGGVRKFRTPISYFGLFPTTAPVAGPVSNLPTGFTSDLLFNANVTLDQIVQSIKTIVGSIIGSTCEEFTVNLVDNNCNVNTLPGVPGEDVISSPIEREMEDAPPPANGEAAV
jgi:hypothetical protein